MVQQLFAVVKLKSKFESEAFISETNISSATCPDRWNKNPISILSKGITYFYFFNFGTKEFEPIVNCNSFLRVWNNWPWNICFFLRIDMVYISSKGSGCSKLGIHQRHQSRGINEIRCSHPLIHQGQFVWRHRPSISQLQEIRVLHCNI